MTILQSYCYCFSLRRGCFIIGIFTLVFHMAVVAGGSFYVHDSIPVALLILSSVMVVLSIFCVIVSVFLIVGLCVESKKLLIPWIAVVSVTTLMEVVFSNIAFFFKPEINTSETKADVRPETRVEETPVIYTMDLLVVLFNIYSILCVFSQYQEYCEGRGTAEYDFRNPRNNKLKVTYSSQSKSEHNSKWNNMESSESRCQLVIPRNSINTMDNSCANSVDETSNTSARSSITATNVFEGHVFETISEGQTQNSNESNGKCDPNRTVVQMEPILYEDPDSHDTRSTSLNDFV